MRAWTLLPTLFAADAFAQADQSVVWNVVAEVDTLITETDARGWDGDEELRGDLRLWYDDADTSGSYEDSLGRAALYLVNSPHAEKIWVRVPTTSWNFLDIVDGTNPDDDTFDLTSPAWGPPIDAFELTGLGIDLIDTDGDAWATAALTGTIPDLADFETATISVTWDDGSPVTQTFTITSLTADTCPLDPYKTAPGTCGCGFLDLDPDNAGGVDTCVSRTAVIDPSVTIGVDTTIGENVWIGPGVTLGTGVTIGATSSIGAGAELGDDVTLGTSVVIDDGAVLADDVFAATRARVGAAATVGVGALLGRRVVIGADADVAAGAVLGSDTLIGRRAQIGASVVSMYSANVGEGASIGASTLLGNLSAVGRSVTVGTNAVIGRAVSISADSTVGNNARFGANDAVGARSQVGAGLIVAANVDIGPGFVGGASARISRNSTLGYGVTLGASSKLPIGASIGAGQSIPASTTVARTDTTYAAASGTSPLALHLTTSAPFPMRYDGGTSRYSIDGEPGQALALSLDARHPQSSSLSYSWAFDGASDGWSLSGDTTATPTLTPPSGPGGGAVASVALEGEVTDGTNTAAVALDVALVTPASCRHVRDAGRARGDGTYVVSPTGAFADALTVTCNMTVASGGWTLLDDDYAAVAPTATPGEVLVYAGTTVPRLLTFLSDALDPAGCAPSELTVRGLTRGDRMLAGNAWASSCVNDGADCDGAYLECDDGADSDFPLSDPGNFLGFSTAAGDGTADVELIPNLFEAGSNSLIPEPDRELYSSTVSVYWRAIP